MKKAIIISAAAALASLWAGGALAQQDSYTYSINRTRSGPIDWRPSASTHQRYTVSVSPFVLANNGLKFNFERELPRPGHWLGTSLSLYLAPPRDRQWGYAYNVLNGRSSLNSGLDDYHRMWGVGTSAMFKNVFSPRGWYFSTGLTLDFYRVGVAAESYVPYVEDGLTFYEHGIAIETKSYFKPTAQINVGKNIALSPRCYFDLYAGVGISYPLFANDERHSYGYSEDRYGGRWYHPMFRDLGGFAYRGLTPIAGFRFGVLLWKPL
jgi:hypothetical protein